MIPGFTEEDDAASLPLELGWLEGVGEECVVDGSLALFERVGLWEGADIELLEVVLLDIELLEVELSNIELLKVVLEEVLLDIELL